MRNNIPQVNYNIGYVKMQSYFKNNSKNFRFIQYKKSSIFCRIFAILHHVTKNAHRRYENV